MPSLVVHTVQSLFDDWLGPLLTVPWLSFWKEEGYGLYSTGKHIIASIPTLVSQSTHLFFIEPNPTSLMAMFFFCCWWLLVAVGWVCLSESWWAERDQRWTLPAGLSHSIIRLIKHPDLNMVLHKDQKCTYLAVFAACSMITAGSLSEATGCGVTAGILTLLGGTKDTPVRDKRQNNYFILPLSNELFIKVSHTKNVI